MNVFYFRELNEISFHAEVTRVAVQVCKVMNNTVGLHSKLTVATGVNHISSRRNNKTWDCVKEE